MPRFINRKQLQKATDEEIEQFFSETVFEGIYSSELKSKNSDFYKVVSQILSWTDAQLTLLWHS